MLHDEADRVMWNMAACHTLVNSLSDTVRAIYYAVGARAVGQPRKSHSHASMLTIPRNRFLYAALSRKMRANDREVEKSRELTERTAGPGGPDPSRAGALT